MKRREIITLLGGAAVWPLVARAQQKPVPVIGFLNSASPDEYAPYVAAFRKGLGEIGYVEGRNVAIEYRWAEDHYDRLSALLADLIGQKVTVIAATSTPAAVAAKAATTTIPVVFTTASDPVHLGLVSNLNRPGGNVTGATQLNVEVGPKRLELMRELIPSATDVGLLLNPANVATGAVSTDQQAAANTFGLRLHVVHASTEREIDDAFAKLVQLRARALIIGSDPFFNTRSEQFAALTLRYSMPSIHAYRAFAASGGLISYGGNLEGSYHTAGTYTGRILKGEKPGDLPVQQSTKIELFINLKTARALGLTIPPTLLALADELIE